ANSPGGPCAGPSPGPGDRRPDVQVTMTVNGSEVTREIEPRLLLVHFLRDHLGLTGTHWGCDTSNCGVCVVAMDGVPVKSCTVLAAMAGGREVHTVEGMERDGELDPVQEGFMQEHGLQCGFCTPAMMITARALRGKGSYLDDIALPGMLHGAIRRSPYAHARIVSIDTAAAEAHPKVKAVITGATLETLNLAWMPTMSGDVQAVLATDKVRFQGQEVAFVVAEDRYAARDALELITVDYEMLPPVVDALRALDADAPVIRTDIDGKADNHVFDWESGDAAACAAVFGRRDGVVASADLLY